MLDRDTGKPILHLTEKCLLGKGAHKAVYTDPRDKTRCINIPYRPDDSDLAREMRYRRALARRWHTPELLTAYYGTVETDKGTGYVFDRVMDYDGSPSLDLQTWFGKLRDGPLEGWPTPAAVLEKLRRMMMADPVVVPVNCAFDDMLVERLSPTEFTVRIIDDIGSRATIPVLFYFGFLARRHAAKRWRRWMGLLRKQFPHIAEEIG